jgi:hypothetical protein
MNGVSYAPRDVTARLRAMSAASDLHSDRRLAHKVPMSAAAVTRRLRVQSELRDACLAWAALGRKAGLHPTARRSDIPSPDPAAVATAAVVVPDCLGFRRAPNSKPNPT